MKCSSTRSKARGLTLVDVFVIIGVLALLAVVLLPSLNSRPRPAKRAACTNNLKQIGLAYRTWSTDNGDKFPTTALTNRDGSLEMAAGTNAFHAFQVMSNELNNPKVLLCPSDNRKLPKNDDFARLQNINVSYFVGLNADETFPAMLLSGDRNLETNRVAVGSGLLVITQTNGLGFTAKMHNRSGNVGLADGSVQQPSSPNLQVYVSRSSTNITRIAVP
jgi:prepilin-type processing-associated H-X9-DG protein